jgi:MFS family permease
MMTRFFLTGWRQVAVIFMLLAAAGMIAATYSIIAIPLAKEYEPSRTVLMLAMTVLSGSSAALLPFVGHLVDRLSIRNTLMAGGFLLGLGYFSLSLTTNFMQVLMIFGLIIAPANALLGPVAGTVLLSRWFVEMRGRALGIAIAGISAGGFLFPIIMTELLEAHDWREAMQWLGFILVLWTVPITALVVSSPDERGLNPDGAATPPVQAMTEIAAAPVTVKEVISDPAFWLIAITVAIVTAGMKGMITNIGPLATDAGIDAARAAYLVSVFAGCSFVAKLIFAALADKVGPRVIMFAALAGFALGLAILTQAQLGYPVIVSGVAVTVFFGGLMIPTESYLAPRVFGQRAVGRALGLLSSTILIGLLCTPPLFGLIFDLTGSYRGIFWAFAGFAILALLWVPAMRLHPRGEAPSAAA